MGAFDEITKPQPNPTPEQERAEYLHRRLTDMRAGARRLDSIVSDYHAKLLELEIPPRSLVDLRRHRVGTPCTTTKGDAGWPLMWTVGGGNYSEFLTAVGWLLADGRTVVQTWGSKSYFTIFGPAKEPAIRLVAEGPSDRIALLSQVATSQQPWPFEAALRGYLGLLSQGKGDIFHTQLSWGFSYPRSLDLELIELYRSSIS